LHLQRLNLNKYSPVPHRLIDLIVYATVGNLVILGTNEVGKQLGLFEEGEAVVGRSVGLLVMGATVGEKMVG
jgi:hypothetical protein